MYNSTLWNKHSTLNHLSHQVTKITVSSLTITRVVADIDDTEVIWIALLRHAGKNTGST